LLELFSKKEERKKKSLLSSFHIPIAKFNLVRKGKTTSRQKMSERMIEPSESRAFMRESLSSLRMIQQPSVQVTVTLYCTDASIYSTSIKIALTYKRVPFDEVPPPDGYGSPAYKAIVPTGKVPALVHNDFTISESAVILEYLEENFNEVSPPLLYACNSQKNAMTRYGCRIHDLYLEPAIRSLFPHVDLTKRDKTFVDTKFLIIYEYLDDLERVCDSHGPFFCGDQMTFADCVLPGTMMLLDLLSEEFLGRGIDYIHRYPKLGFLRENHLNLYAITSVLIKTKEAMVAWLARTKTRSGNDDGSSVKLASSPNSSATSPRTILPKLK
jgi:glutathione S-transferase